MTKGQRKAKATAVKKGQWGGQGKGQGKGGERTGRSRIGSEQVEERQWKAKDKAKDKAVCCFTFFEEGTGSDKGSGMLMPRR